jgi:hypothetical protein
MRAKYILLHLSQYQYYRFKATIEYLASTITQHAGEHNTFAIRVNSQKYHVKNAQIFAKAFTSKSIHKLTAMMPPDKINVEPI